MHISNTQTSQANAYSQQSTQHKFEPISPFKNTQTDTVTLSAEARKMYAPGSRVMMLGDHPVIVAPDDQGNYPTQDKLEEQWNKLSRIPESAQDLIPVATLVIEEDGTINPMREAANKSLAPEQRQNLDEYMQKLAAAFKKEYESRGMTFLDYEAQIKTDVALREEIDQSLREQLWSDPRTAELMNELGISTDSVI